MKGDRVAIVRCVHPVRALSAALVVACACVAGNAQTIQSMADPLQRDEETRERTTSRISPLTLTALEGTVDPEDYYVGPSDLLTVSIDGVSLAMYTIPVTPEGTVLIPTVGEVGVAGMTLARAKEAVIAEIRKKYRTGRVSVTLVSPRPIIVMVTGHVLNPGLFTVTAVSRANAALDMANMPRKDQPGDAMDPYLREGSTRNILLKHRDGGTSVVDLAKFMATNQGRWNPFLREGDIIVVPRRDPARNVIGVYGEVNVPGGFEFVAGDSVKDALAIAHGFTSLARSDSIELSRLSPDGGEMAMQVLSWQRLSTGEIPDVALEPGDRVYVWRRLELRGDYTVTIDGEVRFPGTYPITKDGTLLSEVVRRAGGFTEFAALKSAELSRRSVSLQDLEYERRVSLRGGASIEDSAYFYLETDLRIRKEIINVDFERLFLKQDSSQDIRLQSGDYIHIPPVRQTIYLYGQVVSPGHVPYRPGAPLGYYVEQAGGVTEAARQDDARIIKARTRQWLLPSETAVEAGDYIWVPKEPDRTFAYYMTILSQSAAVLSVVIGMAVLIVQAGR